MKKSVLEKKNDLNTRKTLHNCKLHYNLDLKTVMQTNREKNNTPISKQHIVSCAFKEKFYNTSTIKDKSEKTIDKYTGIYDKLKGIL